MVRGGATSVRLWYTCANDTVCKWRKRVLDQYKRRLLVPFIVGFLVLLCDQATKLWIVQTLGPDPLVHFRPLIGNWFRLVYSQNTGVAFNLFQGTGHTLLIAVSLLISVGVIYTYLAHLPNNNLFVQVSIGLILGGAIGNTIDRVREGFVIDFIQIGWWPVFNIADSAITTGAVLLMICILLMTDAPDQSPPPLPRDDTLLHELLNQDVHPDVRNGPSESEPSGR